MIIDSMHKFGDYLQRDFNPACEEIKNIADKHRVHIQKLLYVNVINRFDSALDDFFMQNLESDGLKDLAKKSMDSAVDEYQLIEYIRGGETYIQDRIRSVIKAEIGKKKHADKVALMLREVGVSDSDAKKSRVHNGTGEIMASFKRQGDYPSSIIGYADWLYARRNVLVHSAKSSFDDAVIERFKSTYNAAIPKNIRLSFGALTNASCFYGCLLSIIKGQM